VYAIDSSAGVTSVINQLRAFLLERGITYRTGRAYLKRQMAAILEDAETNLTPRMRYLLDRLWQEWKSVEADIEELSGQIELIAQQDPACQGLLTVPGVGPLVCTAMIAAVGNGSAFRKGREFSAWLGLASPATLHRGEEQIARYQ
jgi:transposase